MSEKKRSGRKAAAHFCLPNLDRLFPDAVLARQIDHTMYLCRITPAADTEGYAYERKDGMTVLVLWNNAGVGTTPEPAQRQIMLT